MTPEQFAYWLQGYIELENPTSLNEQQTQIIKDHLNLVFNKVTPDRNIDIKFDDISINISDDLNSRDFRDRGLPHYC